MIEKEDGRGFPPERDCTRRRLAEGGIAAVDVCSCGTLQVHIGALTLRMDEAALSELMSTFGRALSENARGSTLSRESPPFRVFHPREPGEA